MTVLLVLASFLVFIVVDYFLNRRKAVQTVPVAAPRAAAAAFGADYVDGFLVPRHISYHSGHSWLVRERKNANVSWLDAIMQRVTPATRRLHHN